jgi:hypothetical protein
MKKLVTYSLAAAIGLGGLLGFTSAGSVSAAEGPPATLIPEPKTVSHHHKMFKKSEVKTMAAIPNEINYYDEEGFRGIVKQESIIDLGNYYIVCYSGVVIRC